MKIIAKLIKMTVTDFETKADEIRDEVTKNLREISII